MKHGVCALLVSMVVLGLGGGRATAQPAAPPVEEVGCGARHRQAFRDALAASPDAGVADKVDEVLYNAAVCYEQEASPDDAITAFEELRTRFPRSPLASRALARLGALHARSARYDAAAAALEEYARRYPTEPGADVAMSDAAHYRKGLGDDDRAIEDTQYFLRTFGAKRPAEAASAFFGLASIYEKRGKVDDLLRHYRAYLKTYGVKGGGDRVVIAYARLGQLLWDQSCRVKAIDGSCVKLAPARAAQCGPASRRAVTTVERDRKKVKEAMAAFAAAIAQYERAGGRFPGGDEVGARRHYAFARFGQIEVDHEAFLRLELPAGLDFNPARPAEAKRSTARFATWLADKQRLGAKATAAYETLIVEVKEPTNAIAAAARLGQLALAFSDALSTAELPAFIRGEPAAVDAYCDALTAAAEPLERRAVESFATCLQVSTELGAFSPWSRLCERELGRLRPDEFPASSELRARPAGTSAPSELEPAIDQLPPPAAP